MKNKIFLSLLSTTLILSLVSCGGKKTSESISEPETTPSEPSEPEVPSEPEEKISAVNIIMTAATIPPVVSALESLKNGYPTYAWIERGKTYAGIEDIENFTNMGFDIANNASSGVTSA